MLHPVEVDRTRLLPAGRALLPLAAFAALAALLLYWAKWHPYWHKGFLFAGGKPAGHSIITGASERAPSPSWSAGWAWTQTYLALIWPALVAALLLGAAAETFVPRLALDRLFAGRRHGWAALAAAPFMMCTCCSAPVAVALRRRRVSPAGALAWWVGNPALNPAVIVFAALLLPWHWTLLRAVSGIALVLLVVPLAARLGGREEAAVPDEPSAPPLRRAPRRYLASLARLSLTLVPEYVVLVFLLGALRGWLFPFAHEGGWGVAAIVALAVAGTLFVIPTGAEIAVVAALLAAGFAAGPTAALLVTLPAVSLPSLAMVARSFPARTLAALAAGVAIVGIADGLVAAALF